MPSELKINDIFIMGGGINGVGIAADAASRGLSVCLAEQHDLASGTSSTSTKLIHGGLRYLEYFEFALVRKALKEREILLKKAPHIIHPLEFRLPYHPKMRALWWMRLGFFLYDHLAKTKLLPASKLIQLTTDDQINSLYQKAFSYYDCQVDDARLVILNAQQAKNYNAEILTRHPVIDLQTLPNCWQITLMDQETQQTKKRFAKILVNATGPWIKPILHKFNLPSTHPIQWVKGSHIVVNKLYDGEQAYILQLSDGRVVFTIPFNIFNKKFTLIGTTDIFYQGDLENIDISQDEVNYLCQAVNTYFRHKLSPVDCIWQFSGIRVLEQNIKQAKNRNPKAISRDYYLELIYKNELPLVNIIGGKLTTYRRLAEQAIDILRPFFPACGRSITQELVLPGGDIEFNHFNLFLQDLQKQYDFLPPELLSRYAHSYGTLTHQLLTSINSIHDLGKEFGQGLYQLEVEYLKQQEWAKTADDILWRRTKLGLLFSDQEKNALKIFLESCESS